MCQGQIYNPSHGQTQLRTQRNTHTQNTKKTLFVIAFENEGERQADRAANPNGRMNIST